MDRVDEHVKILENVSLPTSEALWFVNEILGEDNIGGSIYIEGNASD